MLDSDTLEALGKVIGITWISPLLSTGALTIFKSFIRDERQFYLDAEKLRQAYLEKNCLTFTRLVPIITRPIRDARLGETSAADDGAADIIAALRGNGKGQSDICFEHFKQTANSVKGMETLRRLTGIYKFCHTSTVYVLMVGIAALLTAYFAVPIRGYCVLFSILLMILQLAGAAILRACNNTLVKMENES